MKHRGLEIVTVALVLAASADAARADKAFMQQCAAFIGAGGFSPEKTLDLSSGSAVYITSPPAPDAPMSCKKNLDWVALDDVGWLMFGMKLTVIPAWAGKQPAYCEHSNIEYAVYRDPGLMSPTMVAGGQLWGKTVGGKCAYSVTSWPAISWGSNFATVQNGLPLNKYYVAAHSWYHNHTGSSCGSATSCYAPTKLFVNKF